MTEQPTLAAFAGPQTTPEQATRAVTEWVSTNLPQAWQEAALDGGPVAVRAIRTPEEYREWYPVFGRSGLVAARWDVAYGGLGWSREAAAAAESVLSRYHLPRLNPLGINLAAPALLAFGTEAQRLRFLPPIVRAEQIWCQLFSEPGSGSDLASLATRAERDAARWRIVGQKIWTTWADRADMAVLLARSDPNVSKHAGITYFLLDMHQAGVDVRPLPHIGGETEFFQVFLDGAFVGDDERVGEIGEGWKVAQATLSGERQMVSGAGSGGVDRVGGASTIHLIRLARARAAAGLPGSWDDAAVRDKLVRLWCEEKVRAWTNMRVRARAAGNLAPGPESSIGKVHGAELNQRIQSAASELLGASGLAWSGNAAAAYGDPATFWAGMPSEVRGLMRSRANTIEGGTSEVNKNVLAERVLGMPKEPDPWRGKPWRDLPRG